MRRFPSFRRSFRITRFRSDPARDIADEIDFYLDMRTQELIEEGVEPGEARRRAMAAFGDRTAIERACLGIDRPMERRRRLGEIALDLGQDTYRALRNLWRRPTFPITACLLLALCIALYSGVFVLVRSILLQPLPYPEPDRLVSVVDVATRSGFQRRAASIPDYWDRKEAISAFDDLALYQARTRTFGEPGSVQRAQVLIVTPSFFRTLGVEPLLGPGFSENPAGEPDPHEVVLSFALWRQRFDADPAVLGQSLRVEGQSHRIVGVLPRELVFPSWNARLFLPIAMDAESRSPAARLDPDYEMLARLRPEATLEQARGELDAANRALLERLPASHAQRRQEAGLETRVIGFHDDLVRGVRPWLYLLWGGAACLLLMGGISLTGLLLVRSSGRLADVATRYVLGAGRIRLVRELLTEGLVLAGVGGALGIALAALGLRATGLAEVFDLPRMAEVELDLGAAFSILAVAIGLVSASSLVTAWVMWRKDLHAWLGRGSTAHRGSQRLRGLLASAQVAVASILLVSAALLSSSLFHLLSIDPGFRSEGILAGAVNLPDWRYDDRRSQIRFFDRALDEIRTLPGVTGAAVASQLPLTNPSAEKTRVLVEGRETGDKGSEDPPPDPARTIVSPEYFPILGIPKLAGRAFDDGDDLRSEPVAIVSEVVADRYWGDAQGAVGQRLALGRRAGAADRGPKWLRVVGVVGDVDQVRLGESKVGKHGMRGAVYLPHSQYYRRFTRLVIATEGDPLASLPAVRERITTVDPEVVLFWTTTLEQTVADSLLHVRLPMYLLSVFAAVALLLAALGLYGTLAQSVTMRSREIGIRIALGSSLAETYRWVLGSMGRIVVLGLVVGLLGAVLAAELMSRLLHDVGPGEPGIFLAVGALVGVVALFAALVPARRAARIDPARVLAAE